MSEQLVSDALERTRGRNQVFAPSAPARAVVKSSPQETATAGTAATANDRFGEPHDTALNWWVERC